jgi:hypothetical protein
VVDELGWTVEKIPDSDSVFMRAHETYFRDGALTAGVFTAKDGGMSADWDKYSSKEETRNRAKNPARNAVLSLSVGGVRQMKGLDVEHRPELENRAHSEIDLPDDREELTEIRVFLLRLADIVIPLTRDPVGEQRTI